MTRAVNAAGVEDFRLRVLLVDEDPVITAVAAIALSAESIAVTQASDLTSALARMSERTPDIVVLDAATGELSAWAASGLGLPDRIPDDARVMLLRPEGAGGDAGHRFAVAGYLSRPFDPGELIGAIRSLTHTRA